MKDAELLDNIGVDEFYETMYEEHFKYVMKYVRAYVRDRAYAEDITQETFLVAWNSVDKIQSYESVQAWLIATAKNIMKRHFRQKMQREHVLETLRDTYSRGSRAGQNGTALFADLNPADARILTMYYIQHMSLREIAKTLAIKDSTTRSRLARARSKLEKMMCEKNFLKNF